MNTEQEREAFKKHYRTIFDLSETLDAWGNPRFVHESVEAIWYGWKDRAALQSQDREDAFCVWFNDPETDNTWGTDCRQLFEIYDGTPSYNRMKFCCYCGKSIRESIVPTRRVEGDEE